MARISIIVASYNYEKYIPQTIQSVIEQTYKDWELIIVDDGSKDNSKEIIQSYCQKDSRIRLYTHENNENKGLAETLQLGLKNASGDYVVFLESDDYISSEYLEKKLEIFNKYDNVGFVLNRIELFGANLSPQIKKYINFVDSFWNKNNAPIDISNDIVKNNYIPTFSCVMLKKNLICDCDFQSPKPSWLDLWLWVQISKKTKFYCVPEKLTYWRQHYNSYLHNSNEKYKELYDFYISLYKSYKPKNIAKMINFTNITILKILRLFCSYIYKKLLKITKN